MTVNRTTAYATTSGIALPKQPAAPGVEAHVACPAPVVRDLRANCIPAVRIRAGESPALFAAGAPKEQVPPLNLSGPVTARARHI